MISYDLGPVQFNYRVAGILFTDGKVLIHQEEGEEFWTLPGGRCEILESSLDTLRREIREELGVEIRNGRLVWVVENFFRREGKDWHELAFYYLIDLPQNCDLRARSEPFPGVEEGKILTFRWVGLKDLSNLTLFPEFLAEALDDLPDHSRHLVWKDSRERVVIQE